MSRWLSFQYAPIFVTDSRRIRDSRAIFFAVESRDVRAIVGNLYAARSRSRWRTSLREIELSVILESRRVRGEKIYANDSRDFAHASEKCRNFAAIFNP